MSQSNALDELLMLLKKSRTEDLMLFFPMQKRTATDFKAHFTEADIPSLVQYQVIKVDVALHFYSRHFALVRCYHNYEGEVDQPIKQKRRVYESEMYMVSCSTRCPRKGIESLKK